MADLLYWQWKLLRKICIQQPELIVKYIDQFNKLLKNQFAVFASLRYVTYTLQFARGFLYAKILGPHLFGLLGIIMLYHQYLSFTSLGIQYSLNAELALNLQSSEREKNQIISTSFFIVAGIIVLLALLSFAAWIIDENFFFPPSDFTFAYAVLILAIITFQHFQQLFNNVFRVTQQLLVISLTELMVASLTILVVLFFSGEELILAYLAVWAGSLFLVNLIFFRKKQFQFTHFISWKRLKHMTMSGLSLLTYNFSFHFMTLSSRTIIGIYYPLEIMAYYSLSHSITTVILLGMDAMGWIFFPQVISKVKDGTDSQTVMNVMNKVSNLYSTAGFLVVFLTILLSPVLFLFLPEYSPVEKALTVLLLTQGIFVISYAHVTLAISRRKQNSIALISILASGLSTLIGWLLAVNGFDFHWVAISTFAASLVFNFFMIRLSFKSILKADHLKFSDFMPFSLMVPTAVVFTAIFLPYSYVFYACGFLLFIALNKTHLVDLFRFVLRKMSE
ncbi:MAG TPA: oligosaccharide flippase family protein [Cyclobacteriaceae bacterium]|nr:oligosaccharide flippase family protein [Cyclobacteriaceae bacterium]